MKLKKKQKFSMARISSPENRFLAIFILSFLLASCTKRPNPAAAPRSEIKTTSISDELTEKMSLLKPELDLVNLISGFPKVEIDYNSVDTDKTLVVLKILSKLLPSDIHSDIKTILISKEMLVSKDTVHLAASKETGEISESEICYFLKNLETKETAEKRELLKSKLASVNSIYNFHVVEIEYDSLDTDKAIQILDILLALTDEDIHTDITDIIVGQKLEKSDLITFLGKAFIPAGSDAKVFSADEINHFLKNAETLKATEKRNQLQTELEKVQANKKFPKVEISYEVIDTNKTLELLKLLQTISPKDVHKEIKTIYISGGLSVSSKSVRLDGTNENSAVSEKEIRYVLKKFETMKTTLMRNAIEDELAQVKAIPKFPKIEISYEYVDTDKVIEVLKILQKLEASDFNNDINTIYISDYSEIKNNRFVIDASSGAKVSEVDIRYAITL